MIKIVICSVFSLALCTAGFAIGHGSGSAKFDAMMKDMEMTVARLKKDKAASEKAGVECRAAYLAVAKEMAGTIKSGGAMEEASLAMFGVAYNPQNVTATEALQSVIKMQMIQVIQNEEIISLLKEKK